MRPAVAAVVFACLLLALALTATAAFTILNGLLLAAALYIIAFRLHWTWCAIVFAGPMPWWLDRPHTEPFTFAMHAIAFALRGLDENWLPAATSGCGPPAAT
jgi:hypothetical protein